VDFIAWMHETHRMAEPMLKAALAAAERGDAETCAQASQETAILYLRRYLEVVGDGEAAAGDGVARLLQAAARHDYYFDRLRAEAKLLEAGAESGASAEDIADALKEIRFMAMGRAGKACGFSVASLASGACDPRLKALVTHATTVEGAASIFGEGALYSFNGCVRRGLLSGEPIGAKYLLDPRRCGDFVGFGIVNNYHAGEKVANSQRKGWVDEALEEDYQPSVRLFFHWVEIEGLPGFDNDGMHEFMVRDQVSLDHLVCAVFPSAEARDEALARVREPERREWLAVRCLAAPPECCGAPQDYVRVTNEMVAEHFP
jgi:HEPN domain-containing protein